MGSRVGYADAKQARANALPDGYPAALRSRRALSDVECAPKALGIAHHTTLDHGNVNHAADAFAHISTHRIAHSDKHSPACGVTHPLTQRDGDCDSRRNCAADTHDDTHAATDGIASGDLDGHTGALADVGADGISHPVPQPHGIGGACRSDAHVISYRRSHGFP